MKMKEFMNKVWAATEIEGAGKVIDRRVCYGSFPDIEFTVKQENGNVILVRAKEMWDLGLRFN
jgi:hypothetical protein